VIIHVEHQVLTHYGQANEANVCSTGHFLSPEVGRRSRVPGSGTVAVVDRIAMGIDIGGSGIKGAPVDLALGSLTEERVRIDTPQPSTPGAVADVVSEIVTSFSYEGPVGCTMPSVIQHGVVTTAANIDDGWIGLDGRELLERRLKVPVTLLNDADAAGMAEVTYGAAKNVPGLVCLLTFGTGIGSALLVDGVLVPNSEFGHLEFKGMDAEDYASARTRKEEDLSWANWGGRVAEFLRHVERIMSPDLFIVGGGVSRKLDSFSEFIEIATPIVPARLRNSAGIVGAALAAVAD
jgi:polyphosphate glucokinase